MIGRRIILRKDDSPVFGDSFPLLNGDFEQWDGTLTSPSNWISSSTNFSTAYIKRVNSSSGKGYALQFVRDVLSTGTVAVEQTFAVNGAPSTMSFEIIDKTFSSNSLQYVGLTLYAYTASGIQIYSSTLERYWQSAATVGVHSSDLTALAVRGVRRIKLYLYYRVSASDRTGTITLDNVKIS